MPFPGFFFYSLFVLFLLDPARKTDVKKSSMQKNPAILIAKRCIFKEAPEE
jgi:hypothetical protein